MNYEDIIAELEGRTCKDCASNDICCVTHTDDCPACLDFRTYTKAELEGKHKENKE